MTKECQRVLKTGGFFVSISFGQPPSRELHYKRPHLKMSLTTIPLKDPNNKTPVVSSIFFTNSKVLILMFISLSLTLPTSVKNWKAPTT